MVANPADPWAWAGLIGGVTSAVVTYLTGGTDEDVKSAFAEGFIVSTAIALFPTYAPQIGVASSVYTFYTLICSNVDTTWALLAATLGYIPSLIGLANWEFDDVFLDFSLNLMTDTTVAAVQNAIEETKQNEPTAVKPPPHFGGSGGKTHNTVVLLR